MKNAFLTEMGFTGKIPLDHNNMRVEFVWMIMANADHHNIWNYDKVKDYDQVFVIIPKGKMCLNVEGSPLLVEPNPFSPLLAQPLIRTLRDHNSKVYIIQEGPAWITNDLSVTDQFNWYSNVASADGILCHNRSDVKYFRGVFPHLPVRPIRSWMIPNFMGVMPPADEVIIGGNFSRWYGGFQSYIVAGEFGLPMVTMTSHSTRKDEGLIHDLRHLPRMNWSEWMLELSRYKWAVHLMPTAAAGTFSLNTAWWGIPTIGNGDIDTQRTLFPDLSVHPDDVMGARELAIKLRDDGGFDQFCRDYAEDRVDEFVVEARPHPFFMTGIDFDDDYEF